MDACGTIGPLQTCSDHGVCMGAAGCSCDSQWHGSTCGSFMCTESGPRPCGPNGACFNERVHGHSCGAGNVSLTESLCNSLQSDCIGAYHECPGYTNQVDPTGQIFPEQPKHHSLLYARCSCTNGWQGNDCSIPPPAPPTLEPWPDPYAADPSGALSTETVTALFFGGVVGVIAILCMATVGCTALSHRSTLQGAPRKSSFPPPRVV